MTVDWCSKSAADAAVAATAKSAVGRTDLASGPDNMMGNWLDDRTGKEAEGFLTMVPCLLDWTNDPVTTNLIKESLCTAKLQETCRLHAIGWKNCNQPK